MTAFLEWLNGFYFVDAKSEIKHFMRLTTCYTACALMIRKYLVAFSLTGFIRSVTDNFYIQLS